MRYTYETKNAADIHPGDVLAMLAEEVTQVIPTRKGDRLQVWYGKPNPIVLNPAAKVQVAVKHEDR